jgi:hypothetical protein
MLGVLSSVRIQTSAIETACVIASVSLLGHITAAGIVLACCANPKNSAVLLRLLEACYEAKRGERS